MSKPRNPLSWYVVLSPAYDYTEPVCDDGSGPTYTERDVCFVEAHTKREAQIRAVRHWKRTGAKYLDNASNPFTGVEVRFDPEEDPEEWADNDVVRYEEVTP